MVDGVYSEMGGLRGQIDKLVEELPKHGGFGYVALVQLAENGDVTAAEEIYEMAWEQLHAGPWSEVHRAWRDAFSLACLLLANRSQGKAEDQCLKYLDMGLIMGGLIFRPHLEAAISSAQRSSPQKLDSSESSQLSSKRKWEKQPADAAEEENGKGEKNCNDEKLKTLPPGSLNQLRIKSRCLPSLETFARDYFMTGQPVVITRSMSDWPALSKWKNFEYIRGVAGNRTVPVEIGEHYLAAGWKQELMTIGELLDRSGTPDMTPANRPYLAQHDLFEQIPALNKDILVPDYCALGGGEMKSVNAWLGPSGTVTPLHHDPHHNLLAQVVGQKYVRLYSPSQNERLYPFAESMLGNSSQVDVGQPDLEKFPAFEKITGLDYILEEGDMLYIPPKWWHYVKSLSPSFSVSFWWAVASPVSSDTEDDNAA